MYSVAIVGGKLQGVEAAYLAGKANIRSILFDKKKDVPAKNLCDEFICMDILKNREGFLKEIGKADMILPATENYEVLEFLNDLSKEYELNLAFDFDAYRITSSKIMSDNLFHDNNIASPKYFPHCDGPFIVKPSSESGSAGIRLVKNDDELNKIIKESQGRHGLVIQEYLSGKSYSIEIIGVPGNYKTYEITEIIVDESYDCKRVTAPCDITIKLKNQLRDIAVKIAELIELKGIMDVEVIDDDGVLKVLEIDARIPSQTPTVVYHSTGVNLLEELFCLFKFGKLDNHENTARRHVSYEHILVEDQDLRMLGEHIMGDCRFLNHLYGFYGSDEVLTDYEEDKECWRCTLINVGGNLSEVDQKRKNSIYKIKNHEEEKLECMT